MGRVVTVAIIDFAHSGTTMLAGICEILGVPMTLGDYHRVKWEDHDIIRAAQQGEAAFAALVRERNEAHPVWGFKYPGAGQFAEMLNAHLRNPVYLAIYKDPISVTRRRFGRNNARFMRKARNTMRQMKDSMDTLYASGLPIHLLSYHYAITRPAAFVAEVMGAIGLEPTEEQIRRATDYIQPNMGGPLAKYPKVTPWI